jgi:hypothetical protein
MAGNDAGNHRVTPLQTGRVHLAFIGRPPGATLPHRCNSMETAEFAQRVAGVLESRVMEY